MISLLKNQISLFTIIFLSLLLCSSFIYLNRIKWFKVLFGIWLLSFMLVSTQYLPTYLASRLENEYSTLNVSKIDASEDYYVVVLASGYNADQRLPGIGQLELVSLGRLAEAIRIKRLLPRSYLVCSGYSAFGITSQAATTSKAAIELGVDSEEIILMETPRTTWEEAEAFSKQIGKVGKVILVTDAIHMKRAKAFFERFDLEVVPAPTNFRVKLAINDSALKFLPAVSNIQLMNYVLHEYAGELKYRFLNKQL